MIKKYYYSNSKHPKIPANISCIGNFDSIHKGHQSLINKTINIAKKKNIKAFAIIFSKDPNYILFKEKPLNSLNKRIKLFEKFGLDGVIIIENNLKLLNTSYNDFINDYLKKMNIKGLVVGKDFRFGKDRLGNVSKLKKLMKNVYVCDFVKYYGTKISTCRIKKAIKNKDLKSASRMLGYDYKK